MNNAAPDYAHVDLLALFEEVDTSEPSPEFKAHLAAYNAESARTPGSADYVAPAKCGKCNGTGHLPHFRHIAGGDCFDCDGTGEA